MSRADLLSLTPEAIARLTNLGLVKRAQREIAEGCGPTLAETAEGVVIGTFADGIVATLPPGVALREAGCTCGAVTACRHRVAVALAYADWHGGQDEGGDDWSPGQLDDETLQTAVGRRMWTRARALGRLGLLVEIQHPSGPDRTWTARLPTCSVRFLVPRDLAYVRCDCAERSLCEHVVVAAWAFADADPARRSATVEVRREAEEGPEPALPTEPLSDALVLVEAFVRQGVVHTGDSFAGRFARTAELLEKAGMAWPALVLRDLEQDVAAYRARSARYRRTDCAGHLAELAARAIAARNESCLLPARLVLGLDTPMVTPLEQVRLMSLGARLFAHGEERRAQVYLADVGSGVLTVLRHEWKGPGRRIAPRVNLDQIAGGQLISRGVKRLASRLVQLGRGPHDVTSQIGRWEDVPPPLRLDDLAGHEAAMRERAPRLLRPRVLAEDVHVVPISAVDEVVYAPGDQALVAWLIDASGQPLRLVRTHRSVTPRALDALALALRAPEPPRFVSGELRNDPAGMTIDPLALVVGDRVVVPDLEAGEEALSDVDLGLGTRALGPIEQIIEAAWTLLADAAHHGLSYLPSDWIGRLRAVTQEAGDAGLVHLGAATGRLHEAAAAEDEASLSRAWRDAAIRCAVAREMV